MEIHTDGSNPSHSTKLIGKMAPKKYGDKQQIEHCVVGDQQDQWITQFFLRHVHASMNLQEAIDAPAWHSENFPISFWPRTARPGVLIAEINCRRRPSKRCGAAAISLRSVPIGRRAG